MRTRTTLPALIILVAIACGARPKANDARARLEAGDTAGAIDAYRRWRTPATGDDPSTLRALALTVVWRELSSEDRAARIGAIRLAERLDDDRLYESVSRLLDDADPVVRVTAAASILRAHPGAPEVVTQALAGADPRARAVAVEALGRKVGQRAAADVHARLSDPEPEVRAAAALALAAMRNTGSVDGLVALATKDPDEQVRAAALAALGELKLRPDVLRGGLADAYLGARLSALSALDHADPEAARAEAAKLLAAEDPYLALRAAVIVARKGDRAGVPALRRAVAAEQWPLRAAAANAAVEIAGKDAAFDLLLPLAEDKEGQVRVAAARALGHAGRLTDARRILTPLLSSSDEDVVLGAAVELVRLGEKSALDTLSRLMTSASPGVRAAAVGQAPETSPVLDAVVGALAAEDPQVRLAAAAAVLRPRK